MADSIPVVDFSAYSLDRDEPDDERFQDLIDDMHGALSTVGGMYLKNHGLSSEKIDDCYRISKKFFEMPLEHKISSEFSTQTYSGYKRHEEERLNLNCEHSDLKELFVYKPDEANQHFPDENLPEFRKVMQELFKAEIPLLSRLLEVFARGLKLEDPQFFVKHHASTGTAGQSSSGLTAAYYPPLTDVEVKQDQIRCGEHCDWSSITLIFSDSPGLEVMLDGQWIPVPVPPKEGAVFMLLGDTMEMWTAGKYIAPKHRVMLPHDSDLGKARQSLFFFGFPDNTTTIEPIDSTEQCPPMESYEAYINSRIANSGA